MTEYKNSPWEKNEDVRRYSPCMIAKNVYINLFPFGVLT